LTDLISVRDLSIEFDNRGTAVPALRGISFRIQPGATVALVGESG
jgi:ABC-type glutathione transport system ATPase component